MFIYTNGISNQNIKGNSTHNNSSQVNEKSIENDSWDYNTKK
jgi:hypothetical protein